MFVVQGLGFVLIVFSFATSRAQLISFNIINNILIIIISHDFLPPSRRGSHGQSDNITPIIKHTPLKVFYGQVPPVENLLPQNAGSIINYLQ